MNRVGNNKAAPILAYPLHFTDERLVRRRVATRRQGRTRPFPGVKVRMMDFYVRELRACAEATGWRFDAFLYTALLNAMRNTQRLFGISFGGLRELSKRDRAKLAGHYQSVCGCGRLLKLGDFCPPRPVPVPGEPLAWAFHNGPPKESN
jgi:hypothetical protein